MRLRASAVAAGLVLFSATAGAVVPRGAGLHIAADELTALPAARVGKPLRTQPRLIFRAAAGPAWAHFAAAAGGAWEAAWDAATGVPSRIYGAGIAAPGANHSPAIAEAAARQVLADHVRLLAPGARASDFVLVSNSTDGDIRSVGFVQYAHGRRVVGGQVSFRFKRDRLFVIGSEALPDVRAAEPTARLARTALAPRATASLRTATALPTAAVTAPRDEVVLPLVGDDAVLGYRVAAPLEIDGGAEGRYVGYADPATGEILALQQLNHFTTGTVQYLGVDRYPSPQRPRIPRPVPGAFLTVDGAHTTSALDGAVTWASSGTVSVITAIEGTLVTVVNKASGGAKAHTTLPLAPGGTALWDASSVVEDDAQVQAYLDVNIVKVFVAAHVDANLPTLGDALTTNVNINDTCNAFFDGKAINFFHATTTCQNTALIQDVLFHEFGHDVHANEIIMGVGAFDGAMSEGAADFLAVNITGDHGMGRGFTYTDEPLRDLDPPDSEARWPEDIGEIHKTGIIFGQTFWDLRKAMIAQYGETDGIAKTLALYVGALRRSVNIPTSLVEVLATDDDDGDLSNGTPNECLIRDAFGLHGLRTATGVVQAPGALPFPVLQTSVRVDVAGLSTRCQGDQLDHAELDWFPRGALPLAGTAVATQVAPLAFWGDLPLAADNAVFFRWRVLFSDGSTLGLPDNLADPYYEVYTGTVVTLYCTDFEGRDPFTNGWTTGTGDGMPSPWAWGAPPGTGATDPHAAFSGSNILALGMGTDYAPGSYSWVKSPPIDIGHYSDVHVQFRRWLAVEDGHFDQARVTANDAPIWINRDSKMGDSSSTHHIDREWRFVDVQVTYHAHGTLTVGWDLTSDPGLELGGWAIDDVCVVANPNAICGDGVKESAEECDDGAANADAPDHCRTYCAAPRCGDGIVDANEECDNGGTAVGGCTPQCVQLVVPELIGCDTGGGGAGALGLGAAVGALLLRRRRR